MSLSKIIVLLLSATSASAFAPASIAKSTNVVAKAFAGGLVGGEGPEPIPFTPSRTSKNFDPVGFAEVGNILDPCSLYEFISVICISAE